MPRWTPDTLIYTTEGASGRGGRACPGAAAIGGRPEHAYQAGAPRQWLQQADAVLKMLPALEKRPWLEAEWPAVAANAWLLK